MSLSAGFDEGQRQHLLGKVTTLMAIQMLFGSLLFDKPQKEGAKRGYACTVERPTGHSNSISFAIPWWIS